MTNQNKLVFAIIVNLFFPGLGNLLFYKQNKQGIIILLGSLILTFFYIFPLLSFFMPTTDAQSNVLLFTSICAGLAFIIDLFLLIVSIVLVVRANRNN